jgi:sRNA-binding carbon storage regulator CsrA
VLILYLRRSGTIVICPGYMEVTLLDIDLGTRTIVVAVDRPRRKRNGKRAGSRRQLNIIYLSEGEGIQLRSDIYVEMMGVNVSPGIVQFGVMAPGGIPIYRYGSQRHRDAIPRPPPTNPRHE